MAECEITTREAADILDAFYWNKLAAMRQAVLHLNMVPTPESTASARRSPFAWDCLSVLIDQDQPDVKRAYAALWFDIHFQDWRKLLPVDLMGLIVTRDSPEVSRWRKSVLERDNHECQDCGAPNNLNAHHIAHWNDEPAGRVDVSNGITVCKSCHFLRHNGNWRGPSLRVSASPNG